MNIKQKIVEILEGLEREEQGRQCPWCGAGSWYHPYCKDGKRRYRLCKWCGTLQNMGEKPQKCILIQCVLDGRHRYWTTSSQPEKCRCAHCGGKMKKVTIQNVYEIIQGT